MRKKDPVPPQYAATPSAVTVVDIYDPTSANETLDVIDQDLVALGTQRLRGRRVIVRLESTVIAFVRTNLRVRARTTANHGRTAYGVGGPRTRGRWNGSPIRPGALLAVEAGTAVDLITEPGYETVFAFIAPDELEAHFRGRQREGAFRPPRGAEILDCDPEKAGRFFEWGKRLATTAARKPALFNDRTDTRSAAQTELLDALLETLDRGTERHPARSDRVRAARSRIVKIAEGYAMANPDVRPQLTNLCRAAGVSERSLEYAFKEIIGMTPTAYLTRVRLHRVRKALQAATRASTSVSAEALNQGFWHFGEFSRAYKVCFGELPSETLRRAPTATAR